MKDQLQQYMEAVEDRLQAHDNGVAETKGRLFDLEQKMVRRGPANPSPAGESWGAQVARHDHELKTFAMETARPSRLRIQLKAVTSATDSGGPLIDPARDAANIMPRRVMRVRDLLRVIPVSSGSVEYASQTTRTNNAVVQAAEGSAKAESALAFDLLTCAIRVIAHWMCASRQVLDDAPQLQGIIDSELRYGLAFAEENQLLFGSGTGVDLEGLTVGATAFSPAFTLTAPTKLDILGLAALQTGLAEFAPDGIIMHPSDWLDIQLLKDTANAYLLGNPGASIEQRLWGLPVVTTTAMTAGKFLVGQFSAAAVLYDRMSPEVQLSIEHSDYFTRNLVAIRAEERIGLAIKQATALTYGDFSDAITAATT